MTEMVLKNSRIRPHYSECDYLFPPLFPRSMRANNLTTIDEVPRQALNSICQLRRKIIIEGFLINQAI
jgi:hypothetical protein